MGSDFSALDAELDTLGAGPSVDALLLAQSYAGDTEQLAQLSAVDALLSELDGDGTLATLAQQNGEARSLPSYLPSAAAQEDLRSQREPVSEEMVLPEPVREDEHGAGARPSHAPRKGSVAPRIGSVPSPAHLTPVLARQGHDDTLEPLDEELLESDVDLVEFSSPPTRRSDVPADTLVDDRLPRASAVPSNAGSLFDLHAPSNDDAQQEADAAFAELFSDATRQSNMPAHNSQVPEQYSDDTETFDSSALAFVEANAKASKHDELDSAEFEIIMDADDDNGPPSMPPRASERPEKRPSFLGRLFGRKED